MDLIARNLGKWFTLAQGTIDLAAKIAIIQLPACVNRAEILISRYPSDIRIVSYS